LITFTNFIIRFPWATITGHTFGKMMPTTPFQKSSFNKEYSDFIPDEPITKILDLGAHYGYFSLWLQSNRPQDEIHSLLVEPSQRCERSPERLAQYPKLEVGSQYLQAAVGNPKEDRTRFFERPFMGGSYFLHPPKMVTMK
jgi:hypothetical protein